MGAGKQRDHQECMKGQITKCNAFPSVFKLEVKVSGGIEEKNGVGTSLGYRDATETKISDLVFRVYRGGTRSSESRRRRRRAGTLLATGMQ